MALNPDITKQLNQKFCMSKREPDLLFRDILESAEKILNYTSGFTKEQFLSNQLIIDAVIRNFEIIGEAANRLPDLSKSKLPTLEWNKLRGFRNRLAHDYFWNRLRISVENKNHVIARANYLNKKPIKHNRINYYHVTIISVKIQNHFQR
jgi:uncharacterized protein with HEPN domain